VSVLGDAIHIISPSPAGGAESVVLTLAAVAPDRTRAVILNQTASENAPPFPLVTQLRDRGVTATEIRCGRRRYTAEIRVLERYLRETPPGVVHTHGYHATWVAYQAAKHLGIPLVATVHGYLTRSLKERLYNFVDRRVLRRFDAVIAVSDGIRNQLVDSGVDRSRVHVVQNGLAAHVGSESRESARRHLGLTSDDRVVGWVGRLSPEKGPDLFLRALARDGTHVGVVIGDGPERVALSELARKLRLSEQRCRFAGYRANASELLPAFDALALTSRMEGTPMVILEAVAAKVPIVAFAVGGIPDLLDDQTAWLVALEDVDALATAMAAALDSPQEAARRAAMACSRLSERLSLPRWLERVWHVYSQAASAPRDKRYH
jgi:glycosyltransferase involved in cell wall biosynthesis